MQTLEESTLGEPFADDEEGGEIEMREKHRVRMQTSQKQRDIERRLNIDGGGEFADECGDEMLRAVNRARTLEQQDRRELLRKLQDPMNTELVVPSPEPAQEAIDCKKGKATLFFSQEIRVALPMVLRDLSTGIFIMYLLCILYCLTLSKTGFVCIARVNTIRTQACQSKLIIRILNTDTGIP